MKKNIKKKVCGKYPGKVLLEYLESRNIDIFSFALDINISPMKLYDIFEGKRKISENIAERISRQLNTTKEFWVNLQE